MRHLVFILLLDGGVPRLIEVMQNLTQAIVFQKKSLGLADSELAKVAIFVEETPKYLS